MIFFGPQRKIYKKKEIMLTPIDDEKKDNKMDELETRIAKLKKNDAGFTYFNEIMTTLREKDEDLQSLLNPNYDTKIQSNWFSWKNRGNVIDWLYHLQYDFKLSDSSIFLTINFVDILLSKHKVSNSSYLHLVAMASLMISCKFCDDRYIPMTDWIEIGECNFSEYEICKMEKNILCMLDWKTSQIIPDEYIDCWLKILLLDNVNVNGDEYQCIKDCVDFIIKSCSIYGKIYARLSKSRLVASAIFMSTTIYLPKYKNKINLELLSKISQCDDLSESNADIIEIHETLTGFIEKNNAFNDMNRVSVVYRNFFNKMNRYILRNNHKDLMSKEFLDLFKINKNYEIPSANKAYQRYGRRNNVGSTYFN